MRGVNLSNNQETKKLIIKQLNYLEKELKENDLADRMQNLYPEGSVFINALYGLTWCELALNYELDSINTEKAYNEAIYAFRQIDSDFEKLIFTKELELEYGAFYNGWKNYLLGKIISFHSVSENDLLQFRNTCESINNVISNRNTPYFESYPDSSWPADVLLCVASLNIHDKNFAPKYQGIIKSWIERVKSNLDSFTGLIPHSINSLTGNAIEGARGSSVSLILRLLIEIDEEFAVEQYKLYKKYFRITRLGVPAIREYPKGKEGKGDIDSGPVIWKVGFAGTIVSIGVSKAFGDYEIANKTSNAMDFYGLSYTIKKRKRYIFGALPMVDAFIAWSRVTPQIKDKRK